MYVRIKIQPKCRHINNRGKGELAPQSRRMDMRAPRTTGPKKGACCGERQLLAKRPQFFEIFS
jgi:hypothetical protein